MGRRSKNQESWIRKWKMEYGKWEMEIRHPEIDFATSLSNPTF